MLSPLFLSFLLLFKTSLAACRYKFIHNASELIEFSNDVNSGATYEGYTVYLVADIDFSGLSSQFKPIGISDDIYFRGTFDGQGYVINNLVMSSSSFTYFGLFGFSYGTTIRNVVLSNSCSFTSTFYSTTTSHFIGGIIGYCYGYYGPCVSENIVNMADVSDIGRLIRGNIAIGFHLGGIAGVLTNSNGGYSISNCVNYGAVTDSGYTNSWTAIGGIVGNSWVLMYKIALTMEQ